MATNLDLDDNLIREAQVLGCHKTKKAAVNAALAEYVRDCRIRPNLRLQGRAQATADLRPAVSTIAGLACAYGRIVCGTIV